MSERSLAVKDRSNNKTSRRLPEKVLLALAAASGCAAPIVAKEDEGESGLVWDKKRVAPPNCGLLPSPTSKLEPKE
jgi:hypothetical protein